MDILPERIERHCYQLEQEIMEARDASLSRAPSALSNTFAISAYCLRTLRKRYDLTTLGAMATDMYFHWMDWWVHYEHVANSAYIYPVFDHILSTCVLHHAPPDVHEAIEAHLKELLHSPETYDPSKRRYHYPLHPTIGESLQLLSTLPPSEPILTLMEKIVIGGLDWGPVPLGRRVTHMAYLVCDGQYEYPGQDSDLSSGLRGAFVRMLQRLFLSECLTYEIFEQCVIHLPKVLYVLAKAEHALTEKRETHAFLRQITIYKERLFAERAQDITKANAHMLATAFRPLLQQHHGVVQAVRLMQEMHVDKLVPCGYETGDGFAFEKCLENDLIRIAQTRPERPWSDQARGVLIEQLKHRSPLLLSTLLPLVPYAWDVLCEALQWQDVLPLLRYVERHSAGSLQPEDVETEEAEPQAQECADPRDVLDIPTVRGLLAGVQPEVVSEALQCLVTAKITMANLARLILSFGGWHRAELEKSIKSGSQIAIKSYGLLPFTPEEGIYERYLELQKIARRGKVYNAGRRRSHAQAVQTALANLALIAGYDDVFHLEWEMEARTDQNVSPDQQTWQINDYLIRVDLQGIEANVAVIRKGRTLKAIPQNVRQSSAYQEAKDVVTRVREHVRRVRRGLLERNLASGRTLGLDELTRLLAIPTIRTMLEKLILFTEDGTLGLLAPQENVLGTLDGARHPLGGFVTIAHPYHLSLAGTLEDWQRAIMHGRIVQPVKQAFRELYLLTPAEQRTTTYSNRFAGHTVDGRIAARLLTERGWQIAHGYREASAYKEFTGLRAIFAFPVVGDYLGSPDPAQTDRIFFVPIPFSQAHQEGDWHDLSIPLEQVPPQIFSEVMRDADLVVSVAHSNDTRYNGEVCFSAEVNERVADLVRALLQDLGLQGVTIEGQFAHVQGKLASYRVHLASASIQIEPGSYLCIVPAGWGQKHEQLFLPFVDQDERKVSEVISKILLLLDDDQITDQSILNQILST